MLTTALAVVTGAILMTVLVAIFHIRSTSWIKTFEEEMIDEALEGFEPLTEDMVLAVEPQVPRVTSVNVNQELEQYLNSVKDEAPREALNRAPKVVAPVIPGGKQAQKNQETKEFAPDNDVNSTIPQHTWNQMQKHRKDWQMDEIVNTIADYARRSEANRKECVPPGEVNVVVAAK